MNLLISSAILALTTSTSLVDASSSLRGKTRTLRADHPSDEMDVGWNRIVGGMNAEEGEFPFFVQWGNRICGASLVAPDVVLSAAHCAEIWDTEVWVGGTRASQTGGDEGGITSNIIRSTKVKHPLYDDNTLRYDFMVMKLNTNVTERQFIKLNSQDSTPAVDNGIGEDLDVMGFGHLSSGGGQPETLQHVTVQYTPDNTCTDQYGSGVDLDIMFCAGVQGGGKDSCQGDSGGPIIEYVDGEPYQVGVVSWGQGCALSDRHGVYARVSAEFDWIKQQVCSLSDNAPDYLECDHDDAVDAPATPAPTPTPGNDAGDSVNGSEVAVLVEFRTDNYPEETTWSIGSYVRFDGDFFSGDERTYKYEIKMAPGDYTVDLEDSIGDGFCCTYGEGYIKISTERPDGTIAVLLDTEGEDVFDDTASLQFTVPAEVQDSVLDITSAPTISPTASPTTLATQTPTDGSPTVGPVTAPAVPDATRSPPVNSNSMPIPTCEDNEGQTFLIDAMEGDRDCTFLKDNMSRFDYLCKFVDVASVCRKTCDSCDVFGPTEA